MLAAGGREGVLVSRPLIFLVVGHQRKAALNGSTANICASLVEANYKLRTEDCTEYLYCVRPI